MKIDMSPEAIRLRLDQVRSLRRRCLSLARSSAECEVIGRCGADNKVQRLSRALDSRKTTVERFHLDRLFRAILIEGELGYGKPEPKVHAEALRQLGIEATEAWSIGDHLEWDVAAPQRLGLYAVWSDFRRAGLPDGTTVVPDRIIHSISELAPGSEIEQ